MKDKNLTDISCINCPSVVGKGGAINLFFLLLIKFSSSQTETCFKEFTCIYMDEWVYVCLQALVTKTHSGWLRDLFNLRDNCETSSVVTALGLPCPTIRDEDHVFSQCLGIMWGLTHCDTLADNSRHAIFSRLFLTVLVKNNTKIML